MKWLKTFNEKIDPDKYIRAGSELKGLGKKTRGSELIDYGYEKKWGFYNAHIGKLGESALATGTVTNLDSKFYFGRPVWSGPQANVTTTLQIPAKDEEELLQDWKLGQQPLGFCIDFRVRPTEKTVRDTSGRQNITPSEFSLFSLCVTLSYWEDGLESYNYIDDDGVNLQPGDPNYADVHTLYQQTKSLDIRTDYLFSKKEFGIFADRQSALKFKKELPIHLEKHKSKIMDILSVVGGTTEDLENVLEAMNNIYINYLYAEDIKPGTSTSSDLQKFFRHVKIMKQK